jgi:CubicO group peptidase (beta-lactamase class C family)
MKPLAKRVWILAALGLCCGQSLAAAPALAQEPGAGQDPRQARMMALEQMIGTAGDESLEKFITEHLAPAYVQEISHETLLDLLRRIRTACARAGGITAEPAGDDGIIMTFEAESGIHTVRFQVEPKPPHWIVELTLARGEAGNQPEPRTLTWDGLAGQLDEEATAGFAGAVLVVRDGEIVLHRGYGFADQERSVSNTTETIFAVGSTPIDFTRAAILKLEQMGRLKTSDPITNFFPDAPDDKRTITLDHLMQSTSGLPNFHHVPGLDEDYDLTWIDGDEAVRRILGRELLFAPGEGEAHSHSAWGLLAAVVEIVSGQSYAEFLQEHFFGPLGMKRTGLYPLAKSFPPNEVAIGYGSVAFGAINSPACWGETSWLVMGSGGMVSNPGDLYKWVEGIRNGRVLSPAAQRKYWTGGVLAGGNDRGFLCVYTEGPGSMMFMCSNAHEKMGDRASELGRSLARIVLSK